MIGLLFAAAAALLTASTTHPLFVVAMMPLAYAFGHIVGSMPWPKSKPLSPQVVGLAIGDDAGRARRPQSRALSRTPSRMLNDVPRVIMRGHWGAL